MPSNKEDKVRKIDKKRKGRDYGLAELFQLKTIRNTGIHFMTMSHLLIKQMGIASVALYVVFQLVGFLLPVVITGYACYWVYKNVLTERPRVMK